ncbi:5'/3'-nucleotidase SurE [Pseudonocardia sp. RS010]|uniref:5'/3'-nucleotidase SurE n=1 Tax=Pseudonocardia sp. RS010 TaxID=3385979 RepID=UPI0039A0F804
MSRSTRALVTNDDGIDSPGLAVLAEAASEAGLDVVVAAPEHQFSGASAALTAVQEDGRTVVQEVDGPGGLPAYAVRAAPAHIVVAGLQGWFDPVPDVVLSGINRGGNVGRAVLHSGTVGAALTAGLHDRRGLAVSLDVPLGAEEDEHWDAVREYLPRVLDLLLDSPLGSTLSLNVPDRPVERHRELRLAPLDPRGVVQTLVEDSDGQGLLLREVETGERAQPDSDRALLAAGHPTLTALRGLTEDPDLLVPERLAHAARLIDERTSA